MLVDGSEVRHNFNSSTIDAVRIVFPVPGAPGNVQNDSGFEKDGGRGREIPCTQSVAGPKVSVTFCSCKVLHFRHCQNMGFSKIHRLVPLARRYSVSSKSFTNSGGFIHACISRSCFSDLLNFSFEAFLVSLSSSCSRLRWQRRSSAAFSFSAMLTFWSWLVRILYRTSSSCQISR